MRVAFGYFNSTNICYPQFVQTHGNQFNIQIGKHFKVATDMAAACGLRPVYYRSRQPEYVNL